MIASLQRRFWFRLLVVAPTIVAGTYFALWACAPGMTLPPPVPLTADRPNELGVGGSAIYSPGGTAGDTIHPVGGGDGALFYHRRVSTRVSLAAALFGGSPSLVGGLAAARITLIDADAAVLAVQADVGWLSAGLRVPVMVPVSDELWLHVTPSAGFRSVRTFDLPVGIAYAGPGGTTLSTELGVSYGGPEVERMQDYGLSFRAGLTLSYRFGRRASE